MGFSYDEHDHEKFSATASSTGAASDVEIVAADSNERVIVRKLLFTTSASATFTLKSGSTVLLDMEATNGMILDDPKALVTGVNENLNYSTDAGNSKVYVEYFKNKDNQ